MLRLVFHILYYTLTILLLVRYYRKAKDPTSLIRKPARWVIFLIVISLASFFCSVIATLLARSQMYSTIWTVIASIGVIAQQVLLTHHIMRRQYLLYVVLPVPDKNDKEETPGRKVHAGKITNQKLEAYFRNEKPYLRTDFKVTELAEVFDVSRATVSGFINKTYGMNFNRYVNGWRIREMERLAALPSHIGKSVDSYVAKAGFTDRRQYNRVLEREKGSKPGTGNVKRRKEE